MEAQMLIWFWFILHLSSSGLRDTMRIVCYTNLNKKKKSLKSYCWSTVGFAVNNKKADEAILLP